jgi:transposase
MSFPGLAQAARRLGGCRHGDEERRHRQHLRQGAIGRSRGGWTTKVHALTDIIGRPFALTLTAGNVSDVKAAPALLKQAGRMRYLLTDKGYDADQLRRSLRDAGAVPVIPAGAAASAPSGERLLPLKDFRRVHTRYDKLAANFLSGVALATAIAFWL